MWGGGEVLFELELIGLPSHENKKVTISLFCLSIFVIPSCESGQYPPVKNAQSYSIVHFTKEFKERKMAISQFQFKIRHVC